MTTQVDRKPIKIKRTPVTFLKQYPLHYSGGWFISHNPVGEAPDWKVEKDERILWCPWCGEWAIFKKRWGESRWTCQGYCGWANTDEYHVKTSNKIWWEDVPLEELRKLNIPKPRTVRRG